jgi:hypothetical protein
MRKILIAMAVAALSVAPALAEPSSPKQRDQPAAADMPTRKRAGSSNPCSVYGPGFVKVEGSGTCVKIGGAVSVGVGGSIGSR